MEDFQVRAVPMGGWRLELTGGPDVQINGALLQGCFQEMFRCATVSGCLTPGEAHLTDT
jgi:hypothetical protein